MIWLTQKMKIVIKDSRPSPWRGANTEIVLKHRYSLILFAFHLKCNTCANYKNFMKEL